MPPYCEYNYIRVVSAVRSVWDGELDTLLLWLDDSWASSSEGEGDGLSRTRSYETNKKTCYTVTTEIMADK